MASFLEDHVRPKIDLMRPAWQREYLTIYAAWASDPIHERVVYDTREVQPPLGDRGRTLTGYTFPLS